MTTKPTVTKPLLLLVSGSPGSGKTSLAQLLSKRTGLYHIERDRLKFGIEFMLNSTAEERINTVVPVYFKAISCLLNLKISCIADGAHFKGKTESDLAKFESEAKVLNIHCRSDESLSRAQARDLERDESNPDWAEKYIPNYGRIMPESVDPLEHGYPTLEVDCSNSYEPNLEEIIEWIYENAKS